MKRLGIVALLFFSTVCLSQNIGQSVSGRVSDILTEKPLVGANVAIFNDADFIKGAATDTLGLYRITELEPGRYKLVITFTGYSAVDLELLIISGKSVWNEIKLSESEKLLDEVVIKSSVQGEVNATTVSIEKTMRIPANFYDPVRTFTSYPGIVTANDQSNAIIAKGYSPNAIQWRLNGLDIVNPNHLANAGTFSDKPSANGGGVNILSSQLIDRTTFFSGALPVQYGNALSGIMDMHLRAGAKDKINYTAQASLIGLDVAVEGPINKDKSTTLLANYRYSTVGLLSELGLDFGGERIGFQDFSFHLNKEKKSGGNFSVFGFGGLSENRFTRKDESEWETEKDRYNIDFEGKTYGLGFTDQYNLKKLAISLGASFSGSDQERSSISAEVLYPYTYRDKHQFNQQLISGFAKVNRKFSSISNFETGIRINYIVQDLLVESVNQLYINPFNPNIKGNVEGALIQPYASWNGKVGSFDMQAGLRYVYFAYNKTSQLEPRLNISRTWNKNQLSLSYGLTSQLQQTQNYLSLNSKNLAFNKAHQLALEWKSIIANNLKLVSSIYYHKLFDIPVDLNNGRYSIINQWDDYTNEQLINSGEGRNYGIESYLEKRFFGSTYFLISASYYQAQYKFENKYYNARFNGNFTSSATAGKEWKGKRQTLGVHARIIYAGGLRQMLIDPASSYLAGTTVFSVSQGYQAKLPDYFRSDLRISWRKNKPSYTRTISIDIQNLTGYQNVASIYYDTFLGKINTRYQVGIIPILAYRVDF